MAQWAHDGTQDPDPMPMLGDPLSGLVTGTQSQPEPVTVRVVEPPPPDISEVRRAVQSVLGDDLDAEEVDDIVDAVAETADIPAPSPSPEQATKEPAPKPDPPARPARPAQPAQLAAVPPARLETPVVSNDGSTKRNSSTTGVVVALVLVAVMIVLGIVVIGSLIETITSIVD